MDHQNLDKALEIFTLLIVGEEVSSGQHVDLYEDYRNKSEVYDILMSLFKKLNLSLYEFGDSLYVSAGDGNRIFGFTNDSKTGFVKLVFNFLISQDLFFESQGRYYIKPRFRALAENYYEENRGRLYNIVTGGDDDALY